ncbi:MAG: transglutaminase domain-containing protein [Alphaproteobacteria bacterium]
MNYDVRLQLAYDYEIPVSGGHHLVRIMPQSLAGLQRVVAASLSFDPSPAERIDRPDFFGNISTAIRYAESHETLVVELIARVAVDRPATMLDVSPNLAEIGREIDSIQSLDPESPHHFRAPSPRVPVDPAITAYAAESVDGSRSVVAVVTELTERIYRDFAYDADATLVDTPVREAFELRRGVCQDFSHLMIAGLRGLGVPAAYVSGFLRTIPPKGRERLVGADAMHAWVRVWCGVDTGWLEFDPTNAVQASNDHIVIGHGRDYGDISPIVGVVKTFGKHSSTQEVDVVPLG